MIIDKDYFVNRDYPEIKGIKRQLGFLSAKLKKGMSTSGKEKELWGKNCVELLGEIDKDYAKMLRVLDYYKTSRKTRLNVLRNKLMKKLRSKADKEEKALSSEVIFKYYLFSASSIREITKVFDVFDKSYSDLDSILYELKRKNENLKGVKIYEFENMQVDFD